MKHRMLILLMLFVAVCLMAAENQHISLNQSSTGVGLLRNSATGLEIGYQVSGIDHVTTTTSKGTFTEVSINGYATTNEVGYPKLPLNRQIITVPLQATVIAKVSDTTKMTIDMAANGMKNPIMPVQPSVSKSQDPKSVPFYYEQSAYQLNRYTNVPTVKVEELGIMRGQRLFAVDFAPMQYNPVTNQLEVITSAKITVEFVGGNMMATEYLREKTASPAFEAAYSQILNYAQNDRSSLVRLPMKYVIITPAQFDATLQPFIDWKIKQGYEITLAHVGTGTGTIGSSTNAIKTYIQGLWTAATPTDPAPSYILFVGDVAQIPAWTGSTDTGHVTDLNYVRLEGASDYIPEIYYGRFSATTTTELQAIVEKTLMYEQYTMPDPSYLEQVVMIAGMDDTYGPKHANGQINFATTNYINTAHGMNSHTYLYPASGSNDAQIVQLASQGVGYINYTAHGSETSWYDPSFTIPNVNSLQNQNKYFFAIGNCCLTNAFDTGTCFGEAMIRAANKGAVGYIGGTNSTYWDEDYWWAVGAKGQCPSTGSAITWIANKTGVYDAIFHEHNEPYADWINSAGSMIYMGNLAVTQANSSRINYYWEIYSIMGDPSIMPYVGLPAQNQVTVPSTILMGLTSLQITADPYSYVSLTRDGVSYGSGLADASGSLTLTITPFDSPGTATLVITRQQRQPYIQTLDVIPNDGAYVLVGSYSISDGNNRQMEAGETADLNMVLSNVGMESAHGLTATLATTDEYITIHTNSIVTDSVSSNGTISLASAFNISASANTPDQHVAVLDVTVTDNENHTWVSHVNLPVVAAAIQVGAMTISDAQGNNNNVFEPGELIAISLPISNQGHAAASAMNIHFVSNNPAIAVSQTSTEIANLGIGQTQSIQLNVTLGSDLTVGSVMPLGLFIESGDFTSAQTLSIPIGIVSETFESGDLTSFTWTHPTTVHWSVVSGAGVPNSGQYALKSGAIGNNQSTSISLTMNVGANGQIKFARKVSSESGYDFLKFYVDTEEKGSWSGTVAWGNISYDVAPGSHTFKWEYVKDTSQTGGSDCAWLDDIIFPPTTSNGAPIFYTNTDTLQFSGVLVGTEVIKTFSLYNLGSGTAHATVNLPEGFSFVDRSSHDYTIAAGSSQKVSVKYSPTAVATIVDSITVTTDDPYMTSWTISLLANAITEVANEDPITVPLKTELQGNYPNPFNPTTTIRFAMKDAGNTSVMIYNIKGQLVRTLVQENMKAGYHQVVWNGLDNKGNKAASGLYLYRLQTGKVSSTRKMLMLK